MNPAARRLLPLGYIGINVLGHIGGKGNNVVIGNLFNFIDALNGKTSMIANPLCFLFGNACFAQLSLSFARQHFNFLPNSKFILKLPNSPHFRAGVTANHA